MTLLTLGGISDAGRIFSTDGRVELGPDALIGATFGVAVQTLGDGTARAGRVRRSRFVPFLGKVRSFVHRVRLAAVRQWLRVRGGPGGNGE